MFAGALRKDVLPGSLIGIHGSQLQYYVNNGIISLPLRHAQQLDQRDVDGNIRKQLSEKAALERDFYSRITRSVTWYWKVPLRGIPTVSNTAVRSHRRYQPRPESTCRQCRQERKP
jgi:hypothetical protein